MGRDNQPKHRQAARRQSKQAASQGLGYDRLLIVCEGSKTEPQYLNDIRRALRLPTAHIHVLPSSLGTEPIQVVESAQGVFENGTPRIQARSFDQIYVVFDRDDHLTYAAALQQAQALDGKLHNDAKQKVPFKAIVSVPCFELWLLLHFEQVSTPAIKRETVYSHLKEYLSDYEKGSSNLYERTKDKLEFAKKNARKLASTNTNKGVDTYTNVYELVEVLHKLRN